MSEPESSGGSESLDRACTALVATCIGLAITVGLWNWEAAQDRLSRADAFESLRAAQDRFYRLDAYANRRREFLEGFVLTLAVNPGHTIEYGPSGFVTAEAGRVPTELQYSPVWNLAVESGAELDHRRLAESLAEISEIVLQDDPSPTARVRRLEFSLARAQPASLPPEVSLRFSNLIPLISRIDQRDAWAAVAQWVAFSRVGPASQLRGRPGASYGTQASDARQRASSERFKIRDLLLASATPADALELLRREYVSAYEVLLEERRDELREMEIPLTGLRVTNEALLFVSAPLILLFQLLFLIEWRLYSQAPAGFPAYGTVDPLRERVPAELAEVAKRVLWLVFLVSPPVIIATGVVFRYDVSEISGLSDTALDVLILRRSIDALSAALDFLHGLALVCSLLAVVEITSTHRGSGSRPFPTRWLSATVTALLVVAVASVVAASGKQGRTPAFMLSSFSLACVAPAAAFVVAVAWRQKSRLGVVLAVAMTLGVAGSSVHSLLEPRHFIRLLRE